IEQHGKCQDHQDLIDLSHQKLIIIILDHLIITVKDLFQWNWMHYHTRIEIVRIINVTRILTIIIITTIILIIVIIIIIETTNRNKRELVSIAVNRDIMQNSVQRKRIKL